MAHIELGYEAAVGLRPNATLYPSRARDRAPAQRAAPARPKFCRINVGQMVRAAFLVLLCLGLSQLPRAEKLRANGAVIALQTKI